jgi:hypothetical protein
MDQLLSSLLPEEAILVRPDQKISVVIAEKRTEPKLFDRTAYTETKILACPV